MSCMTEVERRIYENCRNVAHGRQTNFSRITATPEALAEFMSGFSACCDCPADKLCANYQECYKAMLEWLKQESDTE